MAARDILTSGDHGKHPKMPPSQLPIKYLGLPLSVKKPNKIHYQPMLEAVRAKMEGWTSNFLSYGGRVTLIKRSCRQCLYTTSKPSNYWWGSRSIFDRMRRNYLWKGNATCKGINCLVNWERVCTLKINGGLGIIDLQHQNDALLLKWIWAIENNPEDIWASTLRRFHGITGA